jgi:flagellar biosynthesis protein FlhF
MRLKTYSSATMAEAMELVRQEMGGDAIIVSTQSGSKGEGVRVTAATEAIPPKDIDIEVMEKPTRLDPTGTLHQALLFHAVPKLLSERLLEAAAAVQADDPIMAAAGALEACFAFSPLPESGDGRPVMLIGAPGTGKTVTVAKLAARAILAKKIVDMVSTDTQRAGGIEQLAAFARILGVELKTADTPEAMHHAVETSNAGTLFFIDTAGTNPFSDAEMDYLSSLIGAAKAEPVLVLAAGGDAMESADIAASFAAIGATRMLITRLDMTRRLGSVLAAADAGGFEFCDVSVTPHVADGLSPINPVSLARLILPHDAQIKIKPHLTEAAS